jgi:uncharacterized damage-inducible protein DinB
MNEKERFLEIWEKEYPVTLKVLRAFPESNTGLQPAEGSRTAQQLAYAFVFDGWGGTQAVDGKLDNPPRNMPPMPQRWGDMVTEVERAFRALGDRVRRATHAELSATMKFPTGPKQVTDIRRLDFLWVLLMDMVHHRGQFSVYLRMAGGKVPSIYGPSADEPWR